MMKKYQHDIEEINKIKESGIPMGGRDLYYGEFANNKDEYSAGVILDRDHNYRIWVKKNYLVSQVLVEGGIYGSEQEEIAIQDAMKKAKEALDEEIPKDIHA